MLHTVPAPILAEEAGSAQAPANDSAFVRVVKGTIY